jgi:hypothetical protein
VLFFRIRSYSITSGISSFGPRPIGALSDAEVLFLRIRSYSITSGISSFCSRNIGCGDREKFHACKHPLDEL